MESCNNNSAIKRGNLVAVKIHEMKFPSIGIGRASEAYVPDEHITFTKDGKEKPRFADPEDKRRILVKNAFPGQKVLVRITKNREDRVEAALVEVLERADYEVEPVCQYFGECGGCLMQNIPYKKQLELKSESVLKTFRDDFVTDFKYEGIMPSPKEYRYRNKMELSFGNEYKGGPMCLGFHKKNRYYDIIDVEECHLMNSDFNKIRKFVKDYAIAWGLPHYNSASHEGFLRNLVLRCGENTGEILVGLSVSTQMNHDFTDLGRALMEAGGRGDGAVKIGDTTLELSLKGITVGFLLIENDNRGESVTGEYKVLFGRDYYFEEMMGLTFKVSFYSFFQTNTGSAIRLYDKVMGYVGNVEGKVVYDLFSGTGTIGQITAMEGARVIGAEIVQDAVKAARENARINMLDEEQVNFICGDVFDVLSNENLPKPDMIIVDPPRSGIAPKTFEKILSYGVAEIVYVSCNPKSLLTNIKEAEQLGYKMVRMGLVDQFPQTGAMETCVLLSHKKSQASSPSL